jgi:hypothetical protein
VNVFVTAGRFEVVILKRARRPTGRESRRRDRRDATFNAIYVEVLTYFAAQSIGPWVLVPCGVYVAADLLSVHFNERVRPAQMARKADARQGG